MSSVYFTFTFTSFEKVSTGKIFDIKFSFDIFFSFEPKFGISINIVHSNIVVVAFL